MILILSSSNTETVLGTIQNEKVIYLDDGLTEYNIQALTDTSSCNFIRLMNFMLLNLIYLLEDIYLLILENVYIN